MLSSLVIEYFFFFQAEDGIRDVAVTGVQTCALPILTEMSGGTKQNGQTNPRSARSSKIKTLAWRYLPAISMLVSLSVSPSTAPLTVTWWPACSATLSCASTTYTFLSASFTNTYLAPCSLTHLVVQSPAFSFAPFAPHWLSEIQPVQEPSAAIARVPAKSVAAIAVESLSFMVSPLQKSILW